MFAVGWCSSMQKLFPKIAVAFFILSGLILLLTPHSWWPGFYDLPYMGWAALVCAVAIIVVPDYYKAPLAVILLLNASGDLGLYELYRYGFEYDKLIHFTTPLICVLALTPRFGVWRAIGLIMVAAFAWEFFEFISDALIKTHLFGVYRQHIWLDTAMDLAMNSLGVMAGALYLRYKEKHGTLRIG